MILLRRGYRLAFAIALASAALSACTHGEDAGLPVVQSQSISIDGESVTVSRDADSDRARPLALLKIAQDCLAHGFTSFAFTSVGVPKPHLPNQAPNAPPQIAATRTFNPPTTTVPDIQPGSALTVQFYHLGDPGSDNSIDAGLIAANLSQPLPK